MLKRTAGLVALGCTSLLGGLFACGSSGSSGGGATVALNSTVAIQMYDSSGNASGTCGGTLIAADTVLTSGHCVAGKSWFQVTMPSSGQTAHGSVGYAYDWQDFESSFSHPNHHDLAIIKIDTPMNLSQYPQVATSPLPDGSAVMRISAATGTGFEVLAAISYDGTNRGFPNYYYTTMQPGEQLVTGTALVDPATNTIFGVVSGRGMSSGYLYVARTESVDNWLGAMASCVADPPVTSDSKLGTDCQPKPPPPCQDDGGMSSSSSSGGSGSSSGGNSSNGSSGSSSGGNSSNGSSGSSSGGNSSNGSSGSSSGGNSSNGSSGSGSGGLTTSSSGSSGSAQGGGNSSEGDGGACSGNGSGGYCFGTACGGYTGGPGNNSGGGGGDNGGASSGSSGGAQGSGNPSTGTGGTGGTGAGASGSSSGGASGSGNSTNNGGCLGANCGASDTGDGPSCSGSTCGGCGSDTSCSDGSEDFGNCGCVSGSSGAGGPIY